MSNHDQKKLTPRSVDQSAWYTEVVTRANLADYSPVRGCMVIKPYGYEIWERIQADLDRRIKAMGVKNAYFPLFIPYSFLAKEAEHVEGFAPEVAVVTEAGGEKLEEKLVVRPTSETIIYQMYSQWIESYRDLPLKLNQWANVVRWEKRTQPFLRTTEFLWQEGHTAHSSKEEADQMVMDALEMYHDMTKELLAMYTTKGYKTEAEKFAGALYTTTIEGMMKDGKALQSGTSHQLGQNFAKSFDVKYLDAEGNSQYVWQTSWGLSTRIIGGLIMMHGDDKGLVLPPNVAPTQVIIIPIVRTENKEVVMKKAEQLKAQLVETGFRVELDDSENAPGFKFADAEMRGIPVRIEIGERDIRSNTVIAVMRTTGEKTTIEMSHLENGVKLMLEQIQTDLYDAAEKFATENTREVSSYAEFKELAAAEQPGYIKAYFCGDKALEKQIKEETKYTSRCVPLDTYEQSGKCFMNGESGKITLFARAY